MLHGRMNELLVWGLYVRVLCAYSCAKKMDPMTKKRAARTLHCAKSTLPCVLLRELLTHVLMSWLRTG